MNHKELEVGQRIFYTGDMANSSSMGTITKVREADTFGPKSYDIKYDEERFDGDTKYSRMVYYNSFLPGPGRRFMTEEERMA